MDPAQPDNFVMKLGMRSFAQLVFYPFEYGRTLMQVMGFVFINTKGTFHFQFPACFVTVCVFNNAINLVCCVCSFVFVLFKGAK